MTNLYWSATNGGLRNGVLSKKAFSCFFFLQFPGAAWAPRKRAKKAEKRAKRPISAQELRSQPPFTGVLRGPGRKVPPGVLFECFWAPGSECSKECLLSVFWRFLGPKTPKNTQKALFGALGGRGPKALKKHSGFRPGPLSTPVNGGWDRNPRISCVNFALPTRRRPNKNFSEPREGGF